MRSPTFEFLRAVVGIVGGALTNGKRVLDMPAGRSSGGKNAALIRDDKGIKILIFVILGRIYVISKCFAGFCLEMTNFTSGQYISANVLGELSSNTGDSRMRIV